FGLLKVEGVDAKKFLQGQLTCNMEEVLPSQVHLGAHCNPQGRIISLFRIFFYEDAYYLQMPHVMVPIALQAFKKYAVFFKVFLSDSINEFACLGYNAELLSSSQANGIYPTIYPETSEKFLPHELGLQHTHAISFNKGCYTGQEIIARMHYRGKLKNQLCRASIDLEQVPCRGEFIDTKTDIIGVIVDYHKKNNNTYDLYYIKLIGS
ncbi:MAG: ygfZ, partial [Gammaproteobacteria bacterium]|nr:ygfZ [Gammaproteobacteria bacterium]